VHPVRHFALAIKDRARLPGTGQPSWPSALIIGFIAKIAIVWTIGIIVVVAGIMLVLLGMAGHAVGGRRRYF
jgi:hypothetical protein